jgi:hypothetical protein
LKHVLFDYGHTTLRGAAYLGSRLMHDKRFADFIAPKTTQSSALQGRTDQ